MSSKCMTCAMARSPGRWRSLTHGSRAYCRPPAAFNEAARSRRADRTASELQRKVDLPGDFDETTCRIKVLADFVSLQRLDHRVGQTLAAKVIQSVLDEPATEPLATRFGDKRDIGNATLAGRTIHRRRDVTHYLASALCDKNSARVGSGIVINVAHLSPSPVVAVQNSEMLLQQLIGGRAAKSFGGDPFEHFKI